MVIFQQLNLFFGKRQFVDHINISPVSNKAVVYRFIFRMSVKNLQASELNDLNCNRQSQMLMSCHKKVCSWANQFYFSFYFASNVSSALRFENDDVNVLILLWHNPQFYAQTLRCVEFITMHWYALIVEKTHSHCL